MAYRFCFPKALLTAGRLLLIPALILGIGVGTNMASADPPTGTYYYPPGNVPPGPPPNYNQIDSAYFAGEPTLPLPPPDSGGVYIWVNSAGEWNVANHIYSLGYSIEQFHGSILARLETPPTPGVNIFATNFELFGDTTQNNCYKQNDRWGWYDWGNGLYEIWWDVCTREWKSYGGDPNDLMVMKIDGCAIDFNIWSSGHYAGGELCNFGPDQIYLGEAKTKLSNIPEFSDTYPGIYDQYQEQAGHDPSSDPNITVFTKRDGSGQTFNIDGLIVPGETYPCGPVKNQAYGDRFAGSFVYEGNGVQFSSVCGGMQGPGLQVDGVEIPPLSDNNSDVLINICGGTQIWSLINEFSPWENVNRFGYYPDLGAGNNRIIEFVGPDSIGHFDTTSIPSNTTAGLWLHTDANGNQVIDGSEALLFSQRALTVNSANNSNQWFMVYDVSAYKGTGAVYNFFSPTEDYTFTGDFDYLVFIDDGNIPANYDYNDMMVGMLCYNAPAITCPQNISVQCGGSTDPSVTGYATATISCGSVPVIGYSDSQNGNIISRTWTATDDCGASSSCTQTITIIDTTPPSITCPAPITVECLSQVPAPNISLVTAGDNCDPSPTVTFVSDQSNGQTCPEIITRTYRATDNAGNSAECSQIITVDDNITPTISCPASITIDCAASTDPSNTGYATATDNCAGSPTLTHSDNQINNVITRTWTATDACGNTSQCAQTITLLDSTPPSLSCPSNISVQCLADVPAPNIGLVTASDNCDPTPTVTHTGDVSNGGTCPEIITRAYRATDDAGNYAECSQIITVMDNIAPSITCPGNMNIDCGASIDPSHTGYATATDNCTSSPTITHSDNRVNNIITRTWTATDVCGNSSQCGQILTLLDTTPPTINCPPNASVQCASQVPAPNTALVTVSDNCDTNPIVTHVGDQSDGRTCPEIISRTYRATDASGNYSECTQTITIMDTTPPSITCPSNRTIACSDPIGPEFTGTATASDNCDSSPAISYSDQVNGQQILRTWVAADDCGNANQCTQTITIAPNLPPVIDCPSQTITVITVDLSEICLSGITYSDPDNAIATVEVNGVLMSGPDICFVPSDWGFNDVTVICTDICGASTECSFMVIVGACEFLPGDANVDGLVNIADVVDMWGHLTGFSELPDDGQCDCRPNVPFVPFYGGADVNGSCAFNVADITYLMEYLQGTDHDPQYCPLCPPTEGWIPPLKGGNGDIKIVPVSSEKTSVNIPK